MTDPTNMPDTELLYGPAWVAVFDGLDDRLISPLITAWALDPANRDRAITFGRRLITAKDANALRDAESLGAFEDRATTWAINHTWKAKVLVIKLLGKLKPTPEEIAGSPENTTETE